MSAEKPHYMIMLGRMLTEGTPQINSHVASSAVRAYLSELASVGTTRDQEIWLNLMDMTLNIGDQWVAIRMELRMVTHVSFHYNGPLLTLVEAQILCLKSEEEKLNQEAQEKGLAAISGSVDRMQAMDWLRKPGSS